MTKESNNLEHVLGGLVTRASQLEVFTDPQLEPWERLVLPALRELKPRVIVSETRLSRRVVTKALSGGNLDPTTRRKLTIYASDTAREKLDQAGLKPPRIHPGTRQDPHARRPDDRDYAALAAWQDPWTRLDTAVLLTVLGARYCECGCGEWVHGRGDYVDRNHREGHRRTQLTA